MASPADCSTPALPRLSLIPKIPDSTRFTSMPKSPGLSAAAASATSANSLAPSAVRRPISLTESSNAIVLSVGGVLRVATRVWALPMVLVAASATPLKKSGVMKSAAASAASGSISQKMQIPVVVAMRSRMALLSPKRFINGAMASSSCGSPRNFESWALSKLKGPNCAADGCRGCLGVVATREDSAWTPATRVAVVATVG
mmetsp:Transcript_71198/g.119070  ORF Transcript_71198/g.119070 Transcript_71198/m.119070 type:complete len:201 (+) Transcript_71198:1844-2446(+)